MSTSWRGKTESELDWQFYLRLSTKKQNPKLASKRAATATSKVKNDFSQAGDNDVANSGRRMADVVGVTRQCRVYLRHSYYVGCIRRQVRLALPAYLLERGHRRHGEIWVPQSLQHQRQDAAEHHRVVGQPLGQSTWWRNNSEEWVQILIRRAAILSIRLWDSTHLLWTWLCQPAGRCWCWFWGWVLLGRGWRPSSWRLSSLLSTGTHTVRPQCAGGGGGNQEVYDLFAHS